MSEDLEYIDEDLPEIEISELISIDEDIVEGKHNTCTNFHNDDALYNQINLLIQRESYDIPIKEKIGAFHSIHKKILERHPFRVPANILPNVSIARKNNEDDEFFEAHTTAIQIAAYEKRVSELHKIFLGFKTDSEDLPIFEDIVQPTRVIFDNTSETVILRNDHLRATVSKLFTKRGLSPFDPAFYRLNLVDQINATTSADKTFDIDPTMFFKANVETVIHKLVEASAESTEKISSLYDLWKHLLAFGLDSENYIDTAEYLTNGLITTLHEKIHEIQTADEEIVEILSRSDKYGETPLKALPHCSIHGFYTVQPAIYSKLVPLLENFQKDLLDLYAKFVDQDGLVFTDTTHIPVHAYDIAMAIMNNQITIEDVVNGLKVRAMTEQHKSIEGWFALIKKWDTATVAPALAREVKIATKTLKSVDDEPRDPWFSSINDEITHIKRGEVISKDYVETDVPLRTLDEKPVEKEEIFLDTPLPTYSNDLPVDISGLDEGMREIYSIVLPMFMILQKTSGLPLDYERMTAAVLYLYQPRKTKSVQISEAFADQLPEIHLCLDTASMVDIDNIIKTITDNSVMHRLMKEKFAKIYEAFLTDVVEQVYFLLAWWVCDIQIAVLNHTLHFHIWDGWHSCIDAWGAFGYPLEDTKKHDTGVLIYLLCIIRALIADRMDTYWNRYIKEVTIAKVKLTISAHATLVEKVDAMRTQFKTFEKDVPLKDTIAKTGIQICNQLIKTFTAKDTNRYIIDYMKFLKNMPAVQIERSIFRKLNLGCCLQQLGEKYRGDEHWGLAGVKQAKEIKNYHAKTRVGVQKRPFLMQAGTEAQATIPVSTLQKTTPPDPTYSEWNITTQLINRFSKMIPRDDYNMMLKNTQDLIHITEGYLTILNNTTKNVDTVVVTSFIESQSNESLIECIRKIRQIQYLDIHASYSEKPDEYDFLKSTFEGSFELYDLLLAHNFVSTEVQMTQYRRILQYFLVRQLCFPTKPEFSYQNTLMIRNTKIDIESNLLKQYLTNTLKLIKNWMVTKELNSKIDYTKYITEQREKQNIKRLNIIDQLPPELRDVYNTVKSLNLTEMANIINSQAGAEDDENPPQNAESESESDAETDRGENDDENNDDSLA